MWERHPLMVSGALPHGSVRAASQPQWLAAVRSSPASDLWRADRRKSFLAVAVVLAAYMDWQLGITRPTWAVLEAETGLSRETVARRLVDLHEAGLLGTVASGRTAGTDPLEPDAGNMAAVYVLAVPRLLQAIPQDRFPRKQDGDGVQNAAPAGDQAAPARPTVPAVTSIDAPVDISDTPSLSLSVTAGHKTPACARDVRDLGPVQLVAAGPWWKAGVAPVTKDERMLAAAELRRLDPILRRVSTPFVAALFRDFHLATVQTSSGEVLPGWTVIDVLHGLNNRPDGTCWPHQLTVADVRHVPGWTQHRLRLWRDDPTDPASRPGLAPSQRAALAQRAAAAHAEARRAAARTEAATALTAADRPAAVQADFAAARARIRHRRTTAKHISPSYIA